ncbi:beta strand repeat-containing protein [Pseudoduganella albidiflava]|uniref:PEP-CTERM sorting domain-containing protein n=1 Tax=Pseudoduganella albidiflava TaxID=321983 RepID=A0A411WTY1_9BURK|nr:PEP-CTERM sorting domain-containing protein [Pseudoduganella albidiflava]QBI00241.1 PEP-CTERM sorting domain-containing protein [Pseudoduganella albidiflava]GGY52372.1 hypothetical protein GCM10007387_38230 [Pseudoduganella albidiflava]
MPTNSPVLDIPLPPPSRRLIPHLLPLALALAVSQANAVTVSGQSGTPGRHATTPGASGGHGGAGKSATAVAGAADDAASAYGGYGGRGGDGAAGAPGQNGGNSGNGGNGGSATASHIIRSTAATLTGSASASGGEGGRFGQPGEGGAGASYGTLGTAGDGGSAQALVDIAGTGTISGTATAKGGSSDSGYSGQAGKATATTTIDGGNTGVVLARANAVGGSGTPAGGDAASAITASGHSLDLAATATGGSGFAGNGGTATGAIRATAGSGGIKAKLSLHGGTSYGAEHGTDVVSRNAFAAQTTGALALTLEGTAGGYGAVQHPGHGGNADLALLLDDQTATSVTSTVRATGGYGGNLYHNFGGVDGVAGNGGQARADLQVRAKAPVTLNAAAVGGKGGGGSIGVAGIGGLAVANVIGHADGSAEASSTATATGGAGGSISSEGRHGGTGGEALARAAAHSGTGTARAISTTIGGEGGTGGASARSGDGGVARAINSVAGSTAGNLVLQQVAQGGAGGRNSYAGGAGGQGGNAVSRLAMIDSAAARIDARLEARGGAGGYSAAGVSGNGGGAEAVLELTSRKAGAAITANVYADGGTASRQTGGNYGDAVARSTVSALGSVRNTAVVDARRADLHAPYGNGNATAFARSESTMDIETRAYARTTIMAGTVAQARAESVSTGAHGLAIAEGRGGNVDVAAIAQGTGAIRNYAVASGTGLTGTIQATSITSADGVRVETTVSTPVYHEHSIEVRATAGILDTMQWHGNGNASTASYRPFNPALFDRAPTVGAAFAQTGLVGAGSMSLTGINAVTPGLYHQVTTARFNFDTTAAGDLTLGLFNFYPYGAAFEELELTVSNHGVEILTYTFDSLAAASAFFHDNVLSLGTFGAGGQDIFISADIVYGAEYGHTNFDYALGADNLAPVPEPGTWAMLLLGLSVVLIRQRRRV